MVDDEFWRLIARFAKDGHIQYSGDEDSLWRNVFKNGSVKTIYPTISWE